MIIYIPRLIESAEQADALPEGAIVVNDDGDRYNRLLGVGKWHSAADDRGLDEDLDPRCRQRKITALVPIKAEEEHKGIPLFPRPADAPWPPRSTPNQDVDGRWYYIDEDGYSTAHLGGHPFHDLMVAWIDSLPRVTRYTTPWAPQQ